MGKAHEHTESTRGINKLECDVRYATIGGQRAQSGDRSDQQVEGASWQEYERPERQLEEAIAMMALHYDNYNHETYGVMGVVEAHKGNIKAKDIENYEEVHKYGGGGVLRGAKGLKEGHVSGPRDDMMSFNGKAHDNHNDDSSTTTRPAPVDLASASHKLMSQSKLQTQSQTQSNTTVKAPTYPIAATTYVSQERIRKLTDKLTTMKKLVVTLMDFGGQSVFNVIHHLFLSRNSVYVVTFNMESFVSGPEKRRQSLLFLRFWLSSLIVHTYDKTSMNTALVFLVGTHKDKVPDPLKHQAISKEINAAFKDSLSLLWGNVQRYYAEGSSSDVMGEGDMATKAPLCFFPVDNTIGRKDPVLRTFLAQSEDVFDKQPLTHRTVPLPWYKSWDAMRSFHHTTLDASNSTSGVVEACSLTIDETYALASQCDVPKDHVEYMLRFFHEMGILMWHEEPSLRDVIILDPVPYLVDPATMVICQLTEDEHGVVLHEKEEHRECQRKHRALCEDLSRRGILHPVLLKILWRNFNSFNHEHMLSLLAKLGLFIPLGSSNVNTHRSSVGCSGGGMAAGISDVYLIPSLFPPAPNHNSRGSHTWWLSRQGSKIQSCLLVFTYDELLPYGGVFGKIDLLNKAFLPSGLMDRLVGKLIAWSQETTNVALDVSSSNTSAFNHNNSPAMAKALLAKMSLYKDEAVLSFGNQRFRLTAHPSVNCIRLDVEGTASLNVLNRIMTMATMTIRECMDCLTCFPAVLCDGHPDQDAAFASLLDIVKDPLDLSSFSSNGSVVPLTVVQQAAVDGRGILPPPPGQELCSHRQMIEWYGTWLPSTDLLAHYDVFISYRWSKDDSAFTETLFDLFTNYTLDSASGARPIDVFRDAQRLQQGRDFQVGFVGALCHSTVVMPVCSVEALKRLVTHNPAEVDNLLLEWIVALELLDKGVGSIRRIYPLFLGTHDGPTSNGCTDSYIAGAFDPTNTASVPAVGPTNTVPISNSNNTTLVTTDPSNIVLVPVAGSNNNANTDTVSSSAHNNPTLVDLSKANNWWSQLIQLPSIVPIATIERAIKLFQSQGIDHVAGRTDDFRSQTVSGIVDAIKRINGFKAWANKADCARLAVAPEAVKEACELLKDVQKCEAMAALPNHSHGYNAARDTAGLFVGFASTSISALNLSQSTFTCEAKLPTPLPEILYNANTKPLPVRPLAALVNAIKAELSIEVTGHQKVLAAAIAADILDAESLERYNQLSSIVEKARFIARALDIPC